MDYNLDTIDHRKRNLLFHVIIYGFLAQSMKKSRTLDQEINARENVSVERDFIGIFSIKSGISQTKRPNERL